MARDRTNLGPAAPGEPPRGYMTFFPIRIRELFLLRREYVSPRMVRLTLGGPNLAVPTFEAHVADEHVKLLFPNEDGVLAVPIQLENFLDWIDPQPVSRDYTIRAHRPEAAGGSGEVDIDLVVHEGGLASTWATTAELGSGIWVAGPPRGVVIPDEFTWQAYVGDETALPAIARRLEELPRTQRGVAIIEVADDAEEQQIDAPDGIEIIWLHRDGIEAGASTLLSDAVATIEIPRDEPAYVWGAGETFAMKPVRRWARAAGLGKDQHDVLGYWRRGASGSEHDHEPGHDH